MEKTINSKLIHEGRNFSFLQDEVELPSGRRTYRNVIRHPGAVAIVPVLPDGRIVLVRQYRYAAGKMLLELPAGTLEPGEAIEDCVRRELVEETGYEAGEVKRILSCFMAPGYSSEVIHFYVARNLKDVGSAPEPDEEISVEAMELSEVLKLIEENVIEDAKTMVGILTMNTPT
ncbi:MAG: NUDIX hydrolase [Candidatus Bathyarchaeota archaeon]|nr:MAG: NUDIX hydrolase [Candidatus Bathyarchaeota archaeon]